MLCLQTKIVILTKFASINLKVLFKTLNPVFDVQVLQQFPLVWCARVLCRVNGLAENIDLRSIIICPLLSPEMHTILS